MTVKDIKNTIGSAVTVTLYVAKDVNDAINERSHYVYSFHKYTNLSDNYGKLEVVNIYPDSKDCLDVWAIEG